MAPEAACCDRPENDPAPVLAEVARLIDRLPGLSTTVLKVLETCNRPSAGAGDLGRVISLDPVLTGRLLKLVNSAYYALPRPVGSVTRAVVLLGANTVKQLALGLAILDNFYERRSFRAFSADDFWSHSLCAGAAAKSLAMVTGEPADDHEEYFVAGLMHDLGKIPLYKCAPGRGEHAVRLSCRRGVPLPACELAAMGVDHGTAGRLIAEKWRLGERIADSLACHHRPAGAAPGNRRFVAVVAFANRFANLARIGSAGDGARAADALWDGLIRLDGDTLQALRTTVSREYERARVFLQVAAGGGGDAG